MRSKQHLGELQQLVLLALIRLGDDAYGARIRAELLTVGGRDVTIAAIYVTLVRMEERGLVSSRDGAVPPTGGRPRRVFRVEPAGRSALLDARASSERMWAGVTL